MEYRQIKTSVYEEREKENMRATIAEQAAMLLLKMLDLVWLVLILKIRSFMRE